MIDVIVGTALFLGALLWLIAAAADRNVAAQPSDFDAAVGEALALAKGEAR